MFYFNLHPEELYDQVSIDDYLESLRAKGLKYRVKLIKSGDTLLEVQMYPVNPAWKATKDKNRSKPFNVSKEAQKQLNQNNKQKHILRLIHSNFTTKDIWCTFTCDQENIPKDLEEARKHLKNYFARLRRYIKKHGLPELKYIYAIERVENKKTGKLHVHYHLVMNFSDRDVAENLWTLGGRTHTRRLQPDPDGTFTELANYLAKPETKEGNRKGTKTFSTSINLEKPKSISSDYRLPKTNYKISKKRITEMVLNENKAIEILEEHYKGYKVTGSVKPKFSEHAAGAYMYARMVKRPSNIKTIVKKC